MPDDLEIPIPAVTPQDLRDEDAHDQRIAFAERYDMGPKSKDQRVGGEPGACGLWVAIVPDALAEQSRGGIIIPERARKRQEQFRKGTVLSVGKGTWTQFHDHFGAKPRWIRHYLGDLLRRGDRVIYSRHHADPVLAMVKMPGQRKFTEQAITFTQVENVWAKIEDEEVA